MDGGVPPCPSPCPRGNRGMYAPAGLGEGLHLHESMFLLTKVSAAAPTPGPPSPHVPMHGGGCEVAEKWRDGWTCTCGAGVDERRDGDNETVVCRCWL